MSSRDQFLLERYLAVTSCDGVACCFRVEHEPWPQCPARVELLDSSLLRSVGIWSEQIEPAGASYSPGVSDVSISAPQRITCPRHRPARRERLDLFAGIHEPGGRILNLLRLGQLRLERNRAARSCWMEASMRIS